MFLSSIKELRNIIESRLQLTAPKELKKEQLLHSVWKRYEKTKGKIATLREKWIYRKENFEEKMKNKYETIERYKQEIEILKQQNEIEIHERMYVSFLSQTAFSVPLRNHFDLMVGNYSISSLYFLSLFFLPSFSHARCLLLQQRLKYQHYKLLQAEG